jgi:hypothetical protein
MARKQNLKATIESNRPPTSVGRLDQRLASLIAALKKEYVEKLNALAYRYRTDLAQKARDIVREHHRQFVAHHGDDLAVFSDGLSLAAAAQKRMRALFEERGEGIVAM